MARDTINNWFSNLLQSAPDDLKIAMAAGCEIVYSSEPAEDGGIILTATTKNPVAVVEHNGKYAVYERASDSSR